MFGYIYKTINNINGKYYIGKHKFSGPGVDKDYFGSGIILKKAIEKFGKGNFTTVILEECSDLQTLNQREKYWIEYYKVYDDASSYNIAKGGDGGPIMLSLSQERRQEAIQKRTTTWQHNGYSERMSKKRKEKTIIKVIQKNGNKFLKG